MKKCILTSPLFTQEIEWKRDCSLGKQHFLLAEECSNFGLVPYEKKNNPTFSLLLGADTAFAVWGCTLEEQS